MKTQKMSENKKKKIFYLFVFLRKKGKESIF